MAVLIKNFLKAKPFLIRRVFKGSNGGLDVTNVVNGLDNVVNGTDNIII